MLASALLLLYRTVSVFDGGLSKVSMLVIGFVLGYGAPLIIATVTIAATAPSNEYTRENSVCWLNWYESKALLAFVIPALLIVLINLIILVVVLYKILRRRVGGNAAQSGEKHVLVVIARSLAVLTPFFGITWGLGVGTMVKPDDMGILITFALFNSLQGFFILVFGTLLDKKVCIPLAARIKFKLLTLAYKVRDGTAPIYLNPLAKAYISARPLWSSQDCRLAVPTPRSGQSRLFSCIVPQMWNDLPNTTRTAASFSIFKKLLKTLLFREHLLN
uniref:G-protein coupled receptors family 2 profile 2 domain-containing protein n=1 Tax=Nothobranchius furzeri TaxID=105023 RepID=A0A8C6NR39_NOTFU